MAEKFKRLTALWERGGEPCTKCSLDYQHCFQCEESGIFNATGFSSQREVEFVKAMSYQREKINGILAHVAVPQ